MFDRTDVLWREEPTPAPAETSARDAEPTVDQARQVTPRPGAPGQRPRSTATDPDDQHHVDGEDRAHRSTDADRDRHAREQHRGWQGREAREGRPREQSPSEERAEAYRHRHDSAEAEARYERLSAAHLAGLATPDRPREERADQERDQLARERHARTWTEGRAWTDQDRAGIQRFTKDAPRRTDGHRREHDARKAQPRNRRTRTIRDRDTIADVGMYRAVSYTDISEHHYDNHPYVTRRAVNRMVRDGLLEEHEATGPQGHTFTVLTATARGRDAAHRAALDAGHVPEQETWTGLVKPAELSHDTAVYRAVLDERARIEAEGGRVVRVRLDAELKSRVATATETARAAGGDRAAETAKAAAAQELGLPMKDGHVMYPDAQLDIEDSDGIGGRVNVEIASDHYHAAAIVAKAGAGFALHGSSPSASQNIGRALGRAAARETDSGPGGGSGPGRDGSVEL